MVCLNIKIKRVYKNNFIKKISNIEIGIQSMEYIFNQYILFYFTLYLNHQYY